MALWPNGAGQWWEKVSAVKVPLKIAAVAAIVASIATSGWTADLYTGLAAAKRGDFVTAAAEWQPLAEQGNPDAQFNLSLLYAKGQGVDRSLVIAHKWAELASRQGAPNGAALQAQVAASMSYAQVLEARKLAREWSEIHSF